MQDLHVELEVEHEGRVVHAHVVVLVDPVFHVIDRVQNQDEQQQTGQSDAADEGDRVAGDVRPARPESRVFYVVARYLLEELLRSIWLTRIVG